MRIFDTPDLFGCGIGCSTGCELICEFCGAVHNKGFDIDRDGMEGDSVCHTSFAGKQICDCCFEKIENEIWNRREDILKWFGDILKEKRETLEKSEKLLKKAGGKR